MVGLTEVLTGTLPPQVLENQHIENWGVSSVVEHLPCMQKAVELDLQCVCVCHTHAKKISTLDLLNKI